MGVVVIFFNANVMWWHPNAVFGITLLEVVGTIHVRV